MYSTGLLEKYHHLIKGTDKFISIYTIKSKKFYN